MGLIWVSSLPRVFGFLVFSVCVAIYFEHGGCEKLCPNGGCPESAKNPSHRQAQAQIRRMRRADARRMVLIVVTHAML